MAALQGILEQGQNLSTRSETFGSPGVSAGDAEAFARTAESLLRAWHFPDLGRVTFSEHDQDLVISGRARASHGKGVRAITHAAFNLALLRLSLDAERPFSGVVVIDSPLVVYREPDPEEGSFSPAVKEHFYSSVAEMFRDAQVIILENDGPPTPLGDKANVITFTKTDSGRRGFIPAH